MTSWPGLACTRPGMTATSIVPAFPFHRLPADVAAAKAFRPSDAVEPLIGATLRFGDGLACRADIQHAPAIGQNISVLRYRTGVEDFHALDLGGLIETLDAGAFRVIAGIPLRRHHHRQ